MEKYRELMDRYQFQMGSARGRLATVLDILTDALTLVGQHGVYCRSGGDGPKATLDVRMVMDQMEGSKDLIMETMKELKNRD